MSILEPEVGAKRIAAGARFASGAAEILDDDFRRPYQGIARGHSGHRPQSRAQRRLPRLFAAFGRLLFPVLLLVAIGAAMFIYGSEPIVWLGAANVGGTAFDAGTIALPVTFLVLQLTNRRYGSAYALAQLLAASLVAVAGLLLVPDLLAALRAGPMPSIRIAAGFGGGLFFANLVSILVFECLRGPRWWQAPLGSSFFGGAALAFTAFPLAYGGTEAAWQNPMLSYLGVTAIATLVLIVPYWLLRRAVEPLPGFGGY